MKVSKELIPDGNAADQPDSDFDPKQLAMGVKVEMEHTKNKALAKEIAKDHLAEIPDYYTKLIKMEREAAYPMAPEPEKINLKERWDNKEWNKLDGAPEEDALTQPLRSRRDYGEVSTQLRKIASHLQASSSGKYILKVDGKFLSNFGARSENTIRLSDEYPDARKFREYDTALKMIDKYDLTSRGNVELIYNYGLEDEEVEEI